MMQGGNQGLRGTALACLEEADLDRKVAFSLDARRAWVEGRLRVERDEEFPARTIRRGDVKPGLPATLELASPARVERRGFGSTARLAAFVHAIAHIEWNAINLAWDAVWRFGGMPREYYEDWCLVAAEEARHFSMLRGRLVALGSDYGALPAHAGLWETAEATRHDLLARMALVPRVLEARGLDVTPGLISKLRANADEATASILEIVLADEVGHVRIGSRWFHYLCAERGLEPAFAFEEAVREHFRGRPWPIDGDEALERRRRAGFREDELEALARLAAAAPAPRGEAAAATFPPEGVTGSRSRGGLR